MGAGGSQEGSKWTQWAVSPRIGPRPWKPLPCLVRTPGGRETKDGGLHLTYLGGLGQVAGSGTHISIYLPATSCWHQ